MEITEKLKQKQNEGVEKAQVEYPPATFTNLDQLFLVLSIVAYIFNKIIDVLLIHTYLSGGHLAWGLLTVLIVVVPQLLVHLISYRWHVHDQEATTSLLVIHCSQLGVFLRLVAQFSDGRRWRRSKSHDDSMLYLQQSSDVSLLMLFLGYLESAPQLLLQVYVTSTRDGWQLVQGVSAVLSLLSLAWSNASYAKWMRRSRGDKLPLGWTAAILQLLWRLCFLLARVSALLCCSLLLGGWLLLLLAAHWLLMTGWVLTQQTDLFPAVWEERLFNAVVGGIYCFSFFNVKETPARWRMLAFYSLVFTENVVMTTLFFFYWPRPSDALYTVVLSNVAAGTVLGLLLMLLYYRRFHPNVSGARSSHCCCWGGVSPEPVSSGTAADVLQPGDGGTLRSLKWRAANRVSVTSLCSAGGISLTSQPDPVTSQKPVVTSQRLSPPVSVRDKPFHSASELLAAAAPSGHVTRSAASLPARRGHVTAAERRNQSATAILQRTAVSAEADPAAAAPLSGGPGRVSDIPQLDAVSEGDITLPPPPPAAASDDGGGDTTIGNHSRMTSGLSTLPPDYENIISVSVHRATLGVRAWRTYSDVGDSAHNYSVVTEREGRLDESVSVQTEGTDDGDRGGRHTYENTDNVALMIAHMEDGEQAGLEPAAGAAGRGSVGRERRPVTEEEEEGGRRDASLLVATIDTVERSGVSALFSTPPRRSRSTDDLASAPAPATVTARRRLLNTSFDPGLLVAPPSDGSADYKCPRSPPEAIYARPAKRGGGETGSGRRVGPAASAETRRSKTGLRRPDGEVGKVRLSPAGHNSASHVTQSRRNVGRPQEGGGGPQTAGHCPPQSTGASRRPGRSPLSAAANTPSTAAVNTPSTRAANTPSTAAVNTPVSAASNTPLSNANTPSTAAAAAAASPRRKFSVLRSRFEPAGRRYAVTPAGVAGVAVSRHPSLQEAARALWTNRGRRIGKENAPPPPPAMSPIDL